jgi:hypothetical protein
MSIITVNFKNLCALFTKKLDDELMVGLPDLADFEGIPERDIHYPQITIRAKKTVNPGGDCVIVQQCWVYKGFQRTNRCCLPDGGMNGMHSQHEHSESIFGKILFMVPGVSPGLNLDLTSEKIDELEKRENEKRPRKNRIKVGEFSDILDFENTLYRDQLMVRPEFCKARFHFQHGTLYSILPSVSPPITFEPQGSGADQTDGQFAFEAGLEIEVPENHYAVMRFLNTDARDFVFQGGDSQSYSVTIENSPLSHQQHDGGVEDDPNHFQYFYKLVDPDQQPDPIYLPGDLTSPDADPFCMIGKFGRAKY